MQLIRAGRLKIDDIAIYSVQRRDGESKYDHVPMEWDGKHLEVDHPWVKGLTAE